MNKKCFLCKLKQKCLSFNRRIVSNICESFSSELEEVKSCANCIYMKDNKCEIHGGVINSYNGFICNYYKQN